MPGAACLGYPDALAVTVALPVSIPITVAIAVPLTVAFDKLEQCVPESLRSGQYAAGQRQRRNRPDELAVAIGIRVAVRDAQGHKQHQGHEQHQSHEQRQRYHHEFDPGDARRSRRGQLELGPEPGHQRQRQ